MADRYSPFWDPGTYERSWVQAQWCAGETEAGPMPMSLSWGLPTACQVGSAVVLQMKNFLKNKKLYNLHTMRL
jgi:hypothetical protein